MQHKLWLDDQRKPPDNSWIWAASPEAFVTEVFTTPWKDGDIVSLDHDLGACADGYECAKLLIQYCTVMGMPVLPGMVCHSQNPVGRERIERLIEEAQNG
jgi:hypothetical protein